MRSIAIGFLTFVLFAAFCPGDVFALGDASRKISVRELNSMLGNSDLQVVDVRDEMSWSKSEFKIRGATRENGLDAEAWAAKYSKDKTIVLY